LDLRRILPNAILRFIREEAGETNLIDELFTIRQQRHEFAELPVALLKAFHMPQLRWNL
jgi:hypothetical protein